MENWCGPSEKKQDGRLETDGFPAVWLVVNHTVKNHAQQSTISEVKAKFTANQGWKWHFIGLLETLHFFPEKYHNGMSHDQYR